MPKKTQDTTLTPGDLAAIAQLPSSSTIAGGINAMNQAAFGNPVKPTSQFGIVPTAPLPPPVTAQPPPVVQPPTPTTPAPQGGFNQLTSAQQLLLSGMGGSPRNSGATFAGPAANSAQNMFSPKNAGQDFMGLGAIAPGTTPFSRLMMAHGFGTPTAAPKPSTPPPPPPVPATPQHIHSAGQAMGIRDPNATSFGRALHAQGQPPLTVDGLSRIAHAYTTALNGNPANTQAAEAMAMAHLDVERALAPIGGLSPIAHGGAA